MLSDCFNQRSALCPSDMPLKVPPGDVAAVYEEIQPLPSDPQQRNQTLQEFLAKVGLHFFFAQKPCCIPCGAWQPGSPLPSASPPQVCRNGLCSPLAAGRGRRQAVNRMVSPTGGDSCPPVHVHLAGLCVARLDSPPPPAAAPAAQWLFPVGQSLVAPAINFTDQPMPPWFEVG